MGFVRRINFPTSMSLKKLGRYELLRVVGKGAMGLVYEGLDPNLNRRVAIKTIKVENLSEEAAAEYEVRFRVEAQSAARLQHPNIVSVYDSARDGDIAYMVMEFIQGEDLKHHLDNGNLYTLEQTLGIMQDLLSALDYAHAQSIVHRDIKPANLLIEKSGRVKLTDFGVARIQDSGEATRTQGTMVGTLKYMSPEQVQGRPVDARADIFAAGIVLYQLLTGKRPFDGSTDFAIIQQIVGHAPAAPTFFNSKLPPAMDVVVGRALAKVPEQRYGSAKDFLTELQVASRDAVDPTVVPPAEPRVPGANGTWTATVRAGEAFVGSQPGLQSNAGVGQSTVTQEIELVYWKDIKDSHDVEDLQGFMNKFPSGIYADLARRRLRQLGVMVGDESEIGGSMGTGTVVLPRSAQAYEPTMRLAKGQVLLGSAAALADSSAFAGTVLMDDAPTVFQPTQRLDRAMPAVPASAAADTFRVPAKALSDDETLPPLALSRAAPPASPAAAPLVVAPVVTAPRVAIQDLPPSKRSPLIWVAAGLLLLVGAALGISRLNSPPASSVVSEAAATSAPAPALAASAALTVAPLATSAASVAPTANASAPVATIAPQVFSLGLDPATPKTPAEVKAAADTKALKKADREKEKLARQAQVQAAGTGAATPEPVEEAASAKRLAPFAAPVVAAVAGGTSPRQACEDRMLIGFQICMAEQCAKRAFSNHPVCVDRRAMEERRRESEQSRR